VLQTLLLYAFSSLRSIHTPRRHLQDEESAVLLHRLISAVDGGEGMRRIRRRGSHPEEIRAGGVAAQHHE